MYCPDCNQIMSPIDIVNKALQRWKDCLIPGDRAQDNRPDTTIPLSQERLDMSAYTCLHFLLSHEWRLCIRNRSILGGISMVEKRCSGKDLKTFIQSWCIGFRERL
jgi:hypothetical protein